MNPKDPRNFWNNIPQPKKTVRADDIAARPREHSNIETDEEVKDAMKYAE